MERMGQVERSGTSGEGVGFVAVKMSRSASGGASGGWGNL